MLLDMRKGASSKESIRDIADAGDPVECAKPLRRRSDELALLDITATFEKRENARRVVGLIAEVSPSCSRLRRSISDVAPPSVLKAGRTRFPPQRPFRSRNFPALIAEFWC